MHELINRMADFHVAAAPSEDWRQQTFADERQGSDVPRIGASFANVGIRQSAPPRIQAKLTVSHPGDSAEQEADRVADAVMQMPDAQPTVARDEDPSIQRACAACGGEKEEAKPAAAEPAAGEEEEIQRMEGEEEEIQRVEDEEEVQRMEGEEEEEVMRKEEEEETLQAKSAGVPNVTPAIESQIQSVHSGGAPLARDTRSFFEPRLGADLSNVRVHTGSQAAGVSRQLNARAFTVGNDITFGAGQYQPSSSDGKRLLAHELTHVIQQGGATTGTPRDRE